MSEQSDLRELGPEDDIVKQAIDLLEDGGHDLIVHEAFNHLMSERGRLAAEAQTYRSELQKMVTLYKEVGFCLQSSELAVMAKRALESPYRKE